MLQFFPKMATRPKLMFFGDPHSDFQFVVESVQALKPEAIVLLGDVEARRPLEVELAEILDLTQIWFVPGNHDTDSEASFDNLFGSQLSDRNLHGRVAEIAGVRVAGLGGIFRESVWAPPFEPRYESAAKHLKSVPRQDRWRGGTPLRHRSSIYPEEVKHLAGQRATVLVTHEGLGGHPFGNHAIDELAIAMGVQVVVHGHLHESINYKVDGRLDENCGYQAFGVDRYHFVTWPRNDGDPELEGG